LSKRIFGGSKKGFSKGENGSKNRFFEAKTPPNRRKIRDLGKNGKISECRNGVKTLFLEGNLRRKGNYPTATNLIHLIEEEKLFCEYDIPFSRFA
jgi:hypothetical protein